MRSKSYGGGRGHWRGHVREVCQEGLSTEMSLVKKPKASGAELLLDGFPVYSMLYTRGLAFWEPQRQVTSRNLANESPRVGNWPIGESE